MTTMACVELVEQVSRYLNGGLDARAEFRILEHLTECEDCVRYVEQVRLTIRLLGRLDSGE